NGAQQLPDDVKLDIGPLTVQFIRFFAKDPLRTIRALADGTDLASLRNEHFAPVHFLHQENLNEELTAFLTTMGYTPQRLSFIHDMEKVNTTERSRPSYLTPAILDRVLHAERFFYQLLPEYLPSVAQHQPTR
ncbi:MAG TPA: hypothetical protein PK760_07175, partial [Flavobacteriales bacterium]|nr:hypothetical protein [Flavobacteriales bacterium]